MAKKKKTGEDILTDIIVGGVGLFFSALTASPASKGAKNSRYKTRKPRSKRSFF